MQWKVCRQLQLNKLKQVTFQAFQFDKYKGLFVIVLFYKMSLGFPAKMIF